MPRSLQPEIRSTNIVRKNESRLLTGLEVFPSPSCFLFNSWKNCNFSNSTDTNACGSRFRQKSLRKYRRRGAFSRFEFWGRKGLRDWRAAEICKLHHALRSPGAEGCSWPPVLHADEDFSVKKEKVWSSAAVNHICWVAFGARAGAAPPLRTAVSVSASGNLRPPMCISTQNKMTYHF